MKLHKMRGSEGGDKGTREDVRGKETRKGDKGRRDEMT